MSKNTTTPVRVTQAQVAAAIAAYPAHPTNIPNVFNGRSGDSKAQVWDFCLVCWPEAFWTASDIAAVYYGVHKRGIRTGDGSVLAFENAKLADGSFDLEFTGGRMLSGGHLKEHCQMQKGKGWTGADGIVRPRAKALGTVGKGPWVLDPAFLAHCQKTGVNVGHGYPALPIKKAAAKPGAAKPGAAKPGAAKPGAAKPGASGKGTGKALTAPSAPALSAPEAIRVTPADAIK